MNSSSNHVFFLGGNDAEMCVIREMLKKTKHTFFDKELSWGAKASDYEDELRSMDGFVPVLIELNIDIPVPPESIIIDHHNELAGKDSPTSLDQVASLIGVALDDFQQLVSANDRGYIPAMIQAGATPSDVAKIRSFDRKCQGVQEEEEIVAEGISASFSSKGRLDIITVEFNHTSPLVDRLFGRYENLLIFTPGKANFFGKGFVIKKLNEHFHDAWYGGDLPENGFWGCYCKSKVEQDCLIKIIMGEL